MKLLNQELDDRGRPRGNNRVTGNHSRMTEKFAISRVLIGIREEPKLDQKMASCYGIFVSRW